MYLPPINNVKRMQLSSSRKKERCFAYQRVLETNKEIFIQAEIWKMQGLESQGIVHSREMHSHNWRICLKVTSAGQLGVRNRNRSQGYNQASQMGCLFVALVVLLKKEVITGLEDVSFWCRNDPPCVGQAVEPPTAGAQLCNRRGCSGPNDKPRQVETLPSGTRRGRFGLVDLPTDRILTKKEAFNTWTFLVEEHHLLISQLAATQL